jgi:methylated-DNA-protein-cysteine methyltransferase-like protein
MPKDNSGFFDKVYNLVRQIPYGRVTSYGAIARALGAAGSARMVGWAMNGAGNYEDVPAHRVLNRNGLLTGKHHFPGTDLMQRLLEEEGITVVDDCVQDFKVLFWDPVVELGLLDED